MTQLNSIAAPKLATVVARGIEDEVVERGWPVGDVLGSETELLERFGVSRAVLREAIRIVEHTGAARMRRGPGGGLVVSEPNRDAIAASMSTWFSYVGVTVGELYDARQPLLREAMRNAAARRPTEEVRSLRARIAAMDRDGDLDESAFLDLERGFLLLSDNPGVVLFADALSGLMGARLRGTLARLEPALTDGDARRHLRAYERLADHLEAGDVDEAGRRIDLMLDLVRSRLLDRPARPRRSAVVVPGGRKLAERVAIGIRDDIERAGWPVGSVLGSEPELIERYGVSRAVLREAVRILEHDGAVRTKRGPGGGLVVAVPDIASIVRAAGLALEFERVSPRQLIDVRTALETAAARMMASSIDDASGRDLLAVVESERRGGERAIHRYDVHHRIADASGNRPLALFVRVVSGLVLRHLEPAAASGRDLARIASETHQAHLRIAQAIAAGDPDLAARRMERHLAAALSVLR